MQREEPVGIRRVEGGNCWQSCTCYWRLDGANAAWPRRQSTERPSLRVHVWLAGQLGGVGGQAGRLDRRRAVAGSSWGEARPDATPLWQRDTVSYMAMPLHDMLRTGTAKGDACSRWEAGPPRAPEDLHCTVFSRGRSRGGRETKEYRLQST